MSTFNAHQLRKAGFAHDFQKDFTDDGTRFQIWVRDGVTATYAKSDNMVFLAIRPDYNEIPYESYSRFPSYRLNDEFNGVHEDEVDIEKFVDNMKTVADEVRRFRAGEKLFKTDVNEMTRDELKDYLAQKNFVPKNKADMVFELAWDYGHSAGHHEVEMYYTDLAKLAR